MDAPARLDGSPPLPARMLNEFVYCPRLFYLEWVDGQWASNDDTAEGDFVHRDVDRRRGAAPDPGDPSWPGTTRSVRLENEEHGLVAVIDRIDHIDGTVSPIDYKKGAPRSDGEPWPADRIQVLTQAALLRWAGYRCDRAILSYAKTHSRVEIEVSDETDQEVVAISEQARQLSKREQRPAPLIDSPKCPRCSLASICLPDEMNVLLARPTARPRRITPSDSDSRPMYVVEQGVTVGIKNGVVIASKAGQILARERLIDVRHVVLVGNVQISTQALTRLWGAGATVLWLSYGGWLKGWSQPPPGKFAQLRRSQARLDEVHSMPMARQMVRGKIRNQRVLLRRNARPGAPETVLASLLRLSERAQTALTRADLMGIEGAAAAQYFGHFGLMLRDRELADRFQVAGRQRRPATDPVNSTLSFAYSLLTKELVTTCIGVGLDPYLGVLHADRFGRPSLALDLAEEFRPLVADSVAIQCFNNGELDPAHDFLKRAGAVALTSDGRRAVIRAFERRMDHEITHPTFGYKISYRRVLDVQARMLAAVMLGELEQYVPMVTR